MSSAAWKSEVKRALLLASAAFIREQPNSIEPEYKTLMAAACEAAARDALSRVDVDAALADRDLYKVETPRQAERRIRKEEKRKETQRLSDEAETLLRAGGVAKIHPSTRAVFACLLRAGKPLDPKDVVAATGEEGADNIMNRLFHKGVLKRLKGRGGYVVA